MVKNIPGSRRKRRSERLRTLTSSHDITLRLGSFGIHGFQAFDELDGKLSYEKIGGDISLIGGNTMKLEFTLKALIQ